MACPDFNLTHARDLNLLYGGLSPEHAEALAELMRSKSFVVRPQTHHRISLFAADADTARTTVDENKYLKQLAHGPDIVSCPGTTYCSRALVNTHAVEKALREQTPDTNHHAIRISGCPNGCAQSAVASIGLIGRIQKEQNGNLVEGFSIVIGGGMGKSPVLAHKQADFVSSTEVPQAVKKLIVDT
jgi:sulfite reductase beta subunit-like hemoprotein